MFADDQLAPIVTAPPTDRPELTDVVTSEPDDVNCTQAGSFAHPGNCYQFVRCRARGDGTFVSVIFSCARGTVFDPKLRVCVRDEGQCAPSWTPTDEAPTTRPPVVLPWPSSPSTTASSLESTSTSDPETTTEDVQTPESTSQTQVISTITITQEANSTSAGQNETESHESTLTESKLESVSIQVVEGNSSTSGPVPVSESQTASPTDIPASDVTEVFTETQEPTVTGVPEQTTESANFSSNTNPITPQGMLMKEIQIDNLFHKTAPRHNQIVESRHSMPYNMEERSLTL